MPPTRNEWRIDTGNSELRFTVRHLVISKISGRFLRWRGTVWLDPVDARASSVDIDVDTDSIDTGNADRDAHLRSAEFLDVAHFPSMRFRSREIIPAGDGDFLVSGDLTIRDQVHAVKLFVSDEGRIEEASGSARAAFTAHGGFDRRDFGMGSNSMVAAGPLVVGEKVEVSVEAEATRGPCE